MGHLIITVIMCSIPLALWHKHGVVVYVVIARSLIRLGVVSLVVTITIVLHYLLNF